MQDGINLFMIKVTKKIFELKINQQDEILKILNPSKHRLYYKLHLLSEPE